MNSQSRRLIVDVDEASEYVLISLFLSVGVLLLWSQAWLFGRIQTGTTTTRSTHDLPKTLSEKLYANHSVRLTVTQSAVATT